MTVARDEDLFPIALHPEYARGRRTIIVESRDALTEALCFALHDSPTGRVQVEMLKVKDV